MSRSKRKKRRQHAKSPVVAAAPSREVESRLEPARRRARLAKVGIAVVGPLVFLGSMVLARGTYAGHSKRPSRPLAVPKPFYNVVREDLLRGGILAPAEAPADAQTSTS
jgi:hypothetical protein